MSEGREVQVIRGTVVNLSGGPERVRITAQYEHAGVASAIEWYAPDPKAWWVGKPVLITISEPVP